MAVAQQEAQVNTTASQIPTLESSLKQVVYGLDVLLGLQPGVLWNELAREAEIPGLPPEVLIGLPSDLLRRRPDVRRAERQLAAATAQVGAATADLFPKFFLTGVAGLVPVFPDFPAAVGFDATASTASAGSALAASRSSSKLATMQPM